MVGGVVWCRWYRWNRLAKKFNFVVSYIFCSCVAFCIVLFLWCDRVMMCCCVVWCCLVFVFHGLLLFFCLCLSLSFYLCLNVCVCCLCLFIGCLSLCLFCLCVLACLSVCLGAFVYCLCFIYHSLCQCLCRLFLHHHHSTPTSFTKNRTKLFVSREGFFFLPGAFYKLVVLCLNLLSRAAFFYGISRLEGCKPQFCPQFCPPHFNF
jgi:hypothetical protein